MERILIVEDDAQNNQIIREYLEGHGYSCTQAFSGSEGKLLFSMERFDLVLLDLMLPGIPGEELVSLFSETAPVIVLSAKSGLDSKVGQRRAGRQEPERRGEVGRTQDMNSMCIPTADGR